MPGEFTQLDLATDDVMILDTWDQVCSLYFKPLVQYQDHFLLVVKPLVISPTRSLSGLGRRPTRRRKLELLRSVRPTDLHR